MTPVDNSNTLSSKDAEKPSANIREALSKYIYHWPVFLLGLLICFSVGFIYLRYAKPVYLINSTILIKDKKSASMGSGEDLLSDLNVFGTSKVVENEIEILKSKTLMRKVVERLNLSAAFAAEGHVRTSDLYANKPVEISILSINSKWFGKSLTLSFPNAKTYLLVDKESKKSFKGNLGVLQNNELGVFKISPRANFKTQNHDNLSLVLSDPLVVADRLLGNLMVMVSSKQSSVLVLSFESTVPKLGQDVLNTLVQVYNEAALADKNSTTSATIRFIEDRLKLITGELTDVEKDVEGFKSSRGLTDISNDASLFLDNVKANDAKLAEINLQISVVKDIQRFVNSSSATEKLPTTLGINDPVLLGQINQLSQLQLQKDQLLATTTEDNPLLAPINMQIETTRQAIKSSLQNITKSLEISRANLEGNSSQFKGSIKQIPGQERQLISIKRQQTIKESLYLYLLQKKEEAALSYASAVADSRTVDPAYFSRSPLKPKKQLILLAAFIFGVLLPIGYVHGKEILNNRIGSSAELKKLTDTPLLGEILFNDSSEFIVVAGNSRKAIAEQFRALRTNMSFLSGKSSSDKGRVTLFTSSMSGEGKSFVATNLAATFAISGRRAVILELDLRKPKVSKYLGISNNLGLSNYLIGKVEVEQIIQPSSVHSNLFVIGSGPVPPNPAELLMQEDIETLISYLKSNFDEIIIDTAPIGLVTDAQILSRVADVTLYLVRQDVTFKHQIKVLDTLYSERKFPKLNILLNGMKFGGKYGYGYGYGYYTDDAIHNQASIKSIFKELLKRF